jgi:hypothetical protein
MKATMSKYLAGIPAYLRTAIRRAALRKGLTATVKRLSDPSPLTGKTESTSYRMNESNREVLAEAIFEVENEFESKGNGRPNHPAVTAMRRARNEIYDDLGWNECATNATKTRDEFVEVDR